MRDAKTYRAHRREEAKTENRRFPSFPWPWQWRENGDRRVKNERYISVQPKPQKVWRYDAHGNASRVTA